jgi:hypothetical protein
MARRFRISWIALIIGLAAGLALGLVYTWVFSPLVEFDTRPHQLSAEAREDYLIAISLAYQADGDLRAAVDSLMELRLGNDPFQVLAQTACRMFENGINTNTERGAIEAMIALYGPQGRSDCADQSNMFAVARATPTPFPSAIPVTPSLTPPPSKTPTIAAPVNVTPPTLAPTRTPTDIPQADDYVLANIQTFCSVELAGLIEVYVQNPGVGDEPGIPVQVSWDGGTDRFFTGLKPERGLGYADFQMEANRTYTVEIPDRSRRSTSLSANQCTTEGGQRSTTSYRVIFRRN